MRHALEQPQQRRAFQRPADGDPLAVELHRENQRDEKQRHAAEPGKLRQTRFIVGGNGFQHRDEAQQRGNRKRGGQQAHCGIRPGDFHEPEDQEELRRPGERGGGPRKSFVREFFQEHEWEYREHAEENQIPAEQHRRRNKIWIADVELSEMPGTFKGERADETDERHPFEGEDFRQPQQQHDEQERQTEHRRRIGQRQPQRGHDEQQKRQHGGTRRQQRGHCFIGVDVAGNVQAGFEGFGFEFPREPHAGDDEKHRERAEQEERGRQAGEVGWDFENQRAGRGEREQQHREHGQQRRRHHRQHDGEQVHQQHERPDEEREFLQFENRHQHEQQRERWEEMIELCRRAGRGAAPPLQPRGQGGVEHGEDEIKRERGVEEFVGQVIGGPNRKQSKHRESGDGLGDGNFFVKPRERRDDCGSEHRERPSEQRPRREPD